MNNPDSWPACVYCGQPVDPAADTWIGHGLMTHNRCAWAADEAFWAGLDAQEEEQ